MTTLERAVDDERKFCPLRDFAESMMSLPESAQYAHVHAIKLGAALALGVPYSIPKDDAGMECGLSVCSTTILDDLREDNERLRAAQAKPDVEAINADALALAHNMRVADFNACGGKEEASTREIIQWYLSAKAAMGKPQASDAEIERLSMEANMGRQAEADANVELAGAVEVVKALRDALILTPLESPSGAYLWKYDNAITTADAWLEGK